MLTYIKLILDCQLDKNSANMLFKRYPRALVLFPDNVPDFRHPAASNARGGLAAVFRPMNDRTDLFDAAGIPTLSYSKTEQFDAKHHFKEAFALIGKKRVESQYQSLIVPYLGDQPAFGGGVASPLSTTEMEILQSYLSEIQKHCSQPPLMVKASSLRS